MCNSDKQVIYKNYDQVMQWMKVKFFFLHFIKHSKNVCIIFPALTIFRIKAYCPSNIWLKF